MKKLYQVLIILDDRADMPQLHKANSALDTLRSSSEVGVCKSELPVGFTPVFFPQFQWCLCLAAPLIRLPRSVPLSQCPALFIAARYPSVPQPLPVLGHPHRMPFPLALGSTFSLNLGFPFSLFCLHYRSWLPPFLATFQAMRRPRLAVRWER